MASAEVPTTVSPPRTDVLPDSYAIYATDEQIHVWQFRVNLSSPNGEWYFVESLDRKDGPRLSLEYATLSAPNPDGHWIFSRSYDCRLSCE
jgi:hypothetical protein